MRRQTRLARTLLLLWLGSLSAPAAAQWSSIGDVPEPRRDGATLTFRNRQATIAVTAVSPHVIRVRIARGPSLGRDHSYAVVSRDLGASDARVSVSRAASTIATSALAVTISHRPFRVAIADAKGRSLDEDDADMGVAFAGRAARVWKRLRADEQVYGFGEKSGRLNKRGKLLGGYAYTMWNTDAYGYDWGTDPLYASFPFYLVLREGRAHGIFLDNTHRSYFDVGKEFADNLSFGAEDGELDYYFIDGPHPRQVVQRYAQLTGRMPLPPIWALGFHQCRYSYYPDSRVRFIASNFRERRIPADVLWLDIHHHDGYNPFTWDRERFPDPVGLVRHLASQGFRLVTIVDPHPKKQPGWSVYDEGLAGHHFIRHADGRVYEAPVWPSRAERAPAPSVFPDFSRPATRTWWGTLLRPLVALGIDGIWNDMNEPAVFEAPTWTMPLTVRHDNDGQPTDHREIHNVYGLLMSQATHEGLLRLRPDERPFVLTRASFSGGQRYAALWPGDNQARWSDLRHSLPMLMNLGLSGMPFVGADIGGFGESPTPELFTRWLQAGVFYPFMRAHTSHGTADQEPWSYGVVHEAVNRRAIELRYELLPHVYTVMEEASRTGVPALRPLLLEYPDDARTWDRDEEYLFGADLLVAPVVHEARTSRDLYLPRGTWYDFWTGASHQGSRDISVPISLASIPIFVREGAFIFRQPVVQHTGEMPGQPLRVWVYPAAASSSSLYEDDGRTFAYRRGAFRRRAFSQMRQPPIDTFDTSVTLAVDAGSGSYRPQARALEFFVHWTGPVRAVRAASGSAGRMVDLPRLAGGEIESAEQGWTVVDATFVRVRLRDALDDLRVTIER